MKHATILLAVVVVLFLAGPASAETYTALDWDDGTIGSGGGTWHLATNWDRYDYDSSGSPAWTGPSTGHIPTADDKVYIFGEGLVLIGSDALANHLCVGNNHNNSATYKIGYVKHTLGTLAIGGGFWMGYGSTYTQEGGNLTCTVGALADCKITWATYEHSGGTFAPSHLLMAGNESIDSRYNMSGAAVLNCSGELRMGNSGDTSETAYFTQTGGTAELGALTIGWGPGNYVYGISGGTVTATTIDVAYGSSTFKVTGSWGDGTDNITFDKYEMLAGTSKLMVEINATGIETIKVIGGSGTNVILAGTIKVNAVGTGHTGPYTLLDWSTGTQTESGSFTMDMTGCPDTWSWNSATWQDDNKIVVTVPEPAALALLCLGSLGVLLRRRRK